MRVVHTVREAIGPELFEFWCSLGINLKQLYGQTEATASITSQPEEDVRSDTAGIPIKEVEIRIVDRSEVSCRFPGILVVSYRNAEGRVAAGDAGFIGEGSGHLRIIDCNKDVGKMADGSLLEPK